MSVKKILKVVLKKVLRPIYPFYYPFYMKLLRRAYRKRARYYVITYPKSGRTWLRLILAKIISDKFNLPLDLEIIRIAKRNKLIPPVILDHAGSNKDNLAEYEIDINIYKDKKVVFLARDPRDVVVSLFFQATKREGRFDGSISDFIRDEIFGIERIVNFYNFWQSKKNKLKDFLVIKYEDLKNDTSGEIKKLLKFIDFDVADDIVAEAVRYASFQNMKKMEKEGIIKDERLLPKDKNDKESYKVRKGKVGGYVDYLSKVDITYVNKVMEKLSGYYGYQV